MSKAEVTLTFEEVESLKDWFETDFINHIRNDEDVDNLQWVLNMMRIYEKCKEAIE